MTCNNEEDSLQELQGTGFSPCLVVYEDRYEQRKQDNIANNHERQICDGALADVGEGNAPHREQKDVGEQNRDANSN